MTKQRIVISSLLFIFILTTCSFSYITFSKLTSKTEDIKNIKTIKAKPKLLLSTTGIQAPLNSYIFYYTPTLGQLQKLLVKNHSKVSKNTPVLEYYNYEKDHLYEELQNTLSNERNNKTLNSKNDLHYYSFLNQLKLQMIQTKSSIKSTLFSPINGSISYINSIPSKPNEKILQINSDERIIRANISESELNLLKINQNISVTSSDNTQFTSKIKEISNIPSKIKNGVSYYDILLSTQPNHQIGTHFKIKLASNDIELPTSAIVQKRYVLILKNGKITKREVTYKKSLKSGYINITKGLLIDEKVVKNPTSKLINIYI